MARIPYVIEGKDDQERVYDLYSRILKDRIIFLNDDVDYGLSNSIVAQLLFLESQDPDSDIFMYISSNGGVVDCGMAIYDTMQYIKPDVNTICVGHAYSMAAVILAAGTKGKRSSLPHSRIMLHQPIGGFQGQASDIEIQAGEILKLKDMLYGILAKHTGKTKNKIIKDADRDFYMTSDAALKYGMIDQILDKRV
jgi:ATP-dependent Clp protease, protease subunit